MVVEVLFSCFLVVVVVSFEFSFGKTPISLRIYPENHPTLLMMHHTPLWHGVKRKLLSAFVVGVNGFVGVVVVEKIHGNMGGRIVK